MERLQQMKDLLKETEEMLLEQRIKKMNLLCHNNQNNVKTNCICALSGLALEREDVKIVISYLRSSYITESHKFFIACYVDEPFMEEEPDCIFLDLQCLFIDVDEDLRIMNKELEGQLVQIFSSFKEEIRRWYMQHLYEKMENIFKRIIEEAEETKNKQIYFGGYMEELSLLSNSQGGDEK